MNFNKQLKWKIHIVYTPEVINLNDTLELKR